MFLRIISYISSGFIILLAVFTVIYELKREKILYKPTKMYPYFADIKEKIEKIDVRFPEKTITILRNKGEWIVVNADNFPADKMTIDRLYRDIENIELLSSKTQETANFKKISLLNPNDKETLQGEGIRFTLFGNQKSPYVDFIVGDRLKSYVNPDKIRLFTRYGATGGAYLSEATSDFQYSASHFLTRQFGIPQIQEVISASLMINNQQAFKLNRIVDDKDPKAILFMPSTVPQGKKLLYPLIMRDYMVAFMQQLRPLDAMYLPMQKSIADTQMVLELTNGRTVEIIFWTANKINYMRIIRDDIETPHNFYVYRITQNDYDTLIQPLDKFLVNE
jgi:hypothetical protein